MSYVSNYFYSAVQAGVLDVAEQWARPVSTS